MKIIDKIKSVHKFVKKLERKIVCKLFPHLAKDYYKLHINALHAELDDIHTYLLSLGGIFNNFASVLEKDLKYNKWLLESGLDSDNTDRIQEQQKGLALIFKNLSVYLSLAELSGTKGAMDKFVRIQKKYAH